MCGTRKFRMFVEYVIIATELELIGLHHCFRGSSSLATELPVKWPLIVSFITSPATLPWLLRAGLIPAGVSYRNNTVKTLVKLSNESETLNPRQQFFEVTPLNSVPYIGPPLPHSYTPSQPTQDFEATVKGGPAMIYCPLASQKEWNDILAATKTGIALTGTAAMGKVGPTVGLLDIGESEDSYFFRVSLPGVAREEKGFSCDVDPDGKITIKGVTTTGEKTVCRNSQVFQMQTRNLCPPGHFSVSFLLPGAVNQNKFSGVFEADGILEGVVKKR